jgi:signal transduction histidine kinase
LSAEAAEKKGSFHMRASESGGSDAGDLGICTPGARHINGMHLTPDDERRRSEDTLRSLLQRKDEFFAILLHELRNPLAPIASALEILGRHSGDSGAVLRSRDLIDRQLQQLIRLVDDLLDVSRIERGTVDLQFARVDVSDVVAGAVETARPLIDSRGHQLVAPIPAGQYVVNADAFRLGQVVTNLLINAAKYTNPGGHICVRADRTEIDVMLHVRDNGTGISREQLESVFEMFGQGTATRAARMGGLGIGLSLGRKLVQLHGGSIVAKSEGLGRGSEFTVTLPRADHISQPEG